MIQSIEAFIAYFDSIRRRTITFCRAIPADRIDLAPSDGEFTCGDILRHFAASEQMFTGVAVEGRWSYPGHERPLAPDLESALAYLDATHTAATTRLRTLSDANLMEKRPAPKDAQIRVWRVLMMMTEHEIHHRSQLATYLTLMGVEPPQIFGQKLEDILNATG